MTQPTALRPAALSVALLLAVAPAAPLAAQPPTFEQVTGHRFGDRITLHHQMVRYLETLAEASDRVEILHQGRSWEGRELPLAVVTSPENHARLDSIRATSARLADPRSVDPGELEALFADQPVVVWLGGSIHGFELSGAEGVLHLLERLATAEDPDTVAVLDSAVVLLDPMLNPDGRDAFADTNHRRLGAEANPDPAHWANDYTGWEALGFRTGHYFFDTNRDWFGHTQAETRARVPTLLAWKPQVMVDLHEMGSDAEFFFDPPARPYGPSFPPFARTWFQRFGAAFARAFDEAGFEYMTGERFNYLYPGYTTSFGSYQGAVGMLFEQGSSRGLALERPDGSVRTLADAIEQQATAAWAAVETAAEARRELLSDFHEAHRRAIEEGRQGVRRYFLPAGSGDPRLERELVELLLRNGIEVGRLTGELRVGGLTDRTGAAAGERTFPAGTWVIEAAQPRNRLVRALLAPDQPLPRDFLDEARARVDRAESPRFYDITSWSLPLLFDLQAFGSTAGAEPSTEPAAPPRPEGPSGAAAPERAGYAYLVDGDDGASVAILHHLRRRGIRASMLTAPTRLGDEAVPAGTVVVRVGQRRVPASDGAEPGEKGAGIHEAVRELAERYGVAVRAVDRGHGDPGERALGTGEAIAARPVEVALLAGQPVHAYSFGWAWYTLDRQYRIPTTVIRVGAVAETPLDGFDVLVVPDLFSAEGLAGALGEGGTGRIGRWIRDGGTLVAIGEGVDFVRRGLGLTGLRSWYEENAEPPGPDGAGEGEGAEPIEPQRFAVPGAFLRVELDPEAWLVSGLGGRGGSGARPGAGEGSEALPELPVLVDSARILLPPEGPPDPSRRVVGRYAESTPERPLLLSGHAWAESLERMPGAVFAYEERIERGRVIAFAEDVNFRGYWRGADRLFLNAVLLGPSAP